MWMYCRQVEKGCDRTFSDYYETNVFGECNGFRKMTWQLSGFLTSSWSIKYQASLSKIAAKPRESNLTRIREIVHVQKKRVTSSRIIFSLSLSPFSDRDRSQSPWNGVFNRRRPAPVAVYITRILFSSLSFSSFLPFRKDKKRKEDEREEDRTLEWALSYKWAKK
jgi:hypothetical protein